MVQSVDYMTSIDLFNAFLHLPVHPDHRRFLRFHWRSSLYQFKTTPFGLSIVSYWFTKINKPILQWTRKQDIRVSAYLDDWTVLSKTKSEALKSIEMIIRCLTSLGWLINWKKSQTQSPQVLEHLSFELNTIQIIARFPGKKLRLLRKSI